MRETPYMRRKALAAAFGAHVVDWNREVWRLRLASSRVRDEERARRFNEGNAEGLSQEWREVIAELRASLVARRSVGWRDFGDLWIE